MYQTIYHRPSSVDEAAALFAKGSDSKYLAGGHTLIPVMKQRLTSPSDVIDLARIKELVGIELSADALNIKAATTYFDILRSADARKGIPAIVHLTSALGDLGKNPIEVGTHLVTHPRQAVEIATEQDRVSYYQMMFAPVAFLPLLAIPTLLIAGPMLAVNIFS